jgi:hypothetical protein
MRWQGVRALHFVSHGLADQIGPNRHVGIKATEQLAQLRPKSNIFVLTIRPKRFTYDNPRGIQ